MKNGLRKYRGYVDRKKMLHIYYKMIENKEVEGKAFSRSAVLLMKW